MDWFKILFGMFDRPGYAMERATEHRRSWILAALLLIASMLVYLGVAMPYQLEIANESQAIMIERLASGRPEPQAEAIRAGAQEITAQRMWLSAGVFGVATIVIVWVLRAAMIHFSSMAMGGVSVWGATYACMVWSVLPSACRNILLTMYVLVRGEVVKHQGIAFLVATGDLVEDSRNLVYVFLSGVDLFTLWELALLGIGTAVATRMTRAKGLVLAVVVWAVFTGFKLGAVAIGNAFMG